MIKSSFCISHISTRCISVIVEFITLVLFWDVNSQNQSGILVWYSEAMSSVFRMGVKACLFSISVSGTCFVANVAGLMREDTRPTEEIVREKILTVLESAYPNVLAVEDLVR